ncbi:MAG: hypothetical protein FJ138_05460 [Deltaproteobacteria bacterium]|nr:hypothetical protein [Deltaproteobacteria bacterium]
MPGTCFSWHLFFDAATQGNGYGHGECVSRGGDDLATCCRCSEPMPFKACARCLAALNASSCAEACGQARSYCQTPYSEDPGNCCACVP